MSLGSFILKFNSFWLRNKPLFFFCLVLVFGILILGILRLKISENVFSTLPKGKSFEQFSNLIQNNKILNQVVFSIHVPDKKDADEIQQIVNSFGDSLKYVSGDLLKDITTARPDVEQQVYSFYHENFPFLIDSSYYSVIENKLSEDSIQASVHSSYRQLLSPGSAFLKTFILNDPLAITGKFFKEIGDISNSQGFIIEDGIIYSKDKTQIFITAKTTFQTDNSEKNILLYNKLKQFEENWNNKNAGYTSEFFGTFEIAAENAMQAKADTVVTVSIALALILLILFIYYRKFLIPLYFILPSVFGGIFALGLTGFLRPEISSISLAASAVLIGIILDYSFHFFTHLRHTRSLSLAIKEVSAPMLTGSFTTIMAFSALLFTNSKVLQDFGLFAALALSAASAFTVTGLPVLLEIFSFDYKKMPEEYSFMKLPKFPAKLRYVSLAFVIALTVFLFFESGKIKFDTNLESISYHPGNLINKEQQLTGINPKFEKKIYLFSENKNFEDAASVNFNLFENLSALKKNNKLESFLTSAQFYVPEKVKAQRELKWKNYWDSHKAKTFTVADKTADRLGFNANAFSGFKNWINRETVSEENNDSLAHLLGIDNLIETRNGTAIFISTAVVKNENLSEVKSELRKLAGVEIFDRTETASAMLSSVKNDFNYLLLTSSLIVFFTLLLIYGRIELTLLTFLPMVISWIWILGFTVLLDIKFNFVNVVIATFVFGLGDDFCIFVTDGLLHKYKYKRNILSSYTSAIVLSAITVIIGTGVLFFAKHPAIHSVAAISVLGITIILFLSLVLQPVLFNLFVQNRIEQKKTAVSFLTFIISVFEFTYFVIGCFGFYFIGFILVILPASKKQKRKLLNICISFFARTIIYSAFYVRKKIFARENLDVTKPSIIIANHSSFLDILLLIMLHPRIIILVKDWVYNSPLFGYFIRYAGYIYTETGAGENFEKIKSRLADGYSLLIFPEGSRSADGEIHRFHKGAFYLAQELKLDITLILIHGASYVLPKSEYLVRHGELNLKILPRIKHEDESWGLTYRERTKNISAYFKIEHRKFTDERESAKYLWDRLFNNYVFKGPLLEWYLRIKWKFESNNFQFYNQLIGERKNIADIGCGYGYLSFYLHYKNRERNITGLDYDNDKIEIAQNSFDKNDNLHFQSADIATFGFEEKQDAVLLLDILHYLNEQSQKDVLQSCFENLKPNGILLIRDGISDFKHRHKTTRLTEIFSTMITGFNKNKNDLHFFNSDFIKSFAAKNNLSFEMMEQSKKTSNVLFILRKN